MAEAYLKKPKEVQAIQFTDDRSAEDIQVWISEVEGFPVRFQYADDQVVLIQIVTFEGTRSLYSGDWLVYEDEAFIRVNDEQFAAEYTKQVL